MGGDEGEAETLLLQPVKENPWKKRFKAALAHFSLCFALVLYTIFGGIVFMELEYPGEIAKLDTWDNDVRVHRQNFTDLLTKVYKEKDSINIEDFNILIEERLTEYERVISEATSDGFQFPLSENVTSTHMAKWNHLQAIFFASTIITTIGYGNIVPVTLSGRIFCILFALVGIPLALIVIADLGVLVASSLPKKSPHIFSKLSKPVKSLISAFAALCLLMVYLSVGAALFMFLEGSWTFFESFYFCFITMTTIGFGDLVPEKPQYMFLCTLYILVGLGLTSTIIELVRLEYAKSWKRLQALAETLRRLGEAGGGQGADIAALQTDLKKVLTLVAGKNKGSKVWEKTVDNLVKNINNANAAAKPKIVQIIVYETSV